MVEQLLTTPPFDALASFGVAANDTKPAANHTTPPAPPAKKEDDTVTLSASAQASQLYLQGNSVSQIAAQLGIPTATVDNDLNLALNGTLPDLSVQPVTAQTAAAPSLPSATETATSKPFNAPVVQTAAS